MRRWHAEHDLMYRRWRVELAKHGDDHPTSERFPHMALAPPSLAPSINCHCAHGIGSMRKHTPYDCGNPRCGLCHFEKFYVPKARANKRRSEIRYEMEAYGLPS